MSARGRSLRHTKDGGGCQPDNERDKRGAISNCLGRGKMEMEATGKCA